MATESDFDGTIDSLESLREDVFSKAIDELKNLLSQPLRAFLLGAGCSRCAGLPMMADLTKGVKEWLAETDPQAGEILQAVEGQFAGASSPNIEDFMSELVDLMAIAERREYRGASATDVTVGSKERSHEVLSKAYGSIKAAIRECLIKPNIDLAHHRRFVRALHGSLQAGKSPSKAGVDYFTLNYDTLMEDALALEQVPYVDGFEGGATGWWNPELLHSAATKARVLKLHGGIDWRLFEGDFLPRRMRSGLNVPGETDPVLIWPAATKYREAQRDPYAQLVNCFRTCLRPRNNSDLVVAILGYSFGDAHINAEIEAGLSECSERVTCLVFTEDAEPTGLIKDWVESPQHREQIHVYSKRGYFHNNTARISDTDLPWWKFEVLARLIGGER